MCKLAFSVAVANVQSEFSVASAAFSHLHWLGVAQSTDVWVNGCEDGKAFYWTRYFDACTASIVDQRH